MEQLAQFVTKSFEFNNCFSAKLLEAKQRPSVLTQSSTTSEAFLNFGLSTNSSSSSSNSNGSSSGTGNNNSLLMDIDTDEGEPEEIEKDVKERKIKVNIPEEDFPRGKCEKNVFSDEKGDNEDEEEDEIDIETDSMSDLEDNKRLIVKAQIYPSDKSAKVQGSEDVLLADRLRVIKPTDLRIHSGNRVRTVSPKESSYGSDVENNKDEPKSGRSFDVNNNTNKNISHTVIKPPIIATKNWLIPDSPGKEKDSVGIL